MGRLTWQQNGEWGLVNGDIKKVPIELYGAMCKLKDYENTGLNPAQIEDMDTLYKEKCEEVARLEKSDWIPVSEKMPEQNRYILVSFENCSGVDIARYEEDEEGGAFYPGDDNVSYVSCGIFVNAWQQLPEPYITHN